MGQPVEVRVLSHALDSTDFIHRPLKTSNIFLLLYKVMMREKFRVISLFSGCGGLDLGILGDFTVFGKKYQKRKFNIVWANDIDKSACETFRKNIGSHITYGDITNLIRSKEDFLKL